MAGSARAHCGGPANGVWRRVAQSPLLRGRSRTPPLAKQRVCDRVRLRWVQPGRASTKVGCGDEEDQHA